MSDTPEARLAALEARVERLEAELAARRWTPPPVPPPPKPGDRVDLPSPAPTPRRPGVALESEAVLKWVGVTLVVLAVGFAVSTAINRGWIGPELQLGGAVAFSLALTAVGFRLRSTRLPWAHALCAGGVAALLTTFASDLFVDRAGDDAAFAAVAVVAALAYGLSRLVPSEWTGGVTLLGTIVAWLVVADFEPPFATTLALVAGLAVTAVGLSLDRGWFALRFAGHGVALVMVPVVLDDADTSLRQGAVVVAVLATFLSLARVPSVGDSPGWWQRLEMHLAAVAAPWTIATLAATHDIDGGTELGTWSFAVALATAGLALALGPRLHAVHLVSLALGASLATTIGLTALVDHEIVFVALAVQGWGLLRLAHRLDDRVRLPLNGGLLLWFAALYAVIDTTVAWTDDAPAGIDAVHLAVIAVLAVASVQGRHELNRLWGGVAVLGMILNWLGSVLVHLPEGQAVVSVSWAVVGTGLLVTGAVRKVPELGGTGLAVLAVTVGKLLLVDMQEVDTLWRAGLFLLVGLGLLRLGFLLPRLTKPEITD